ncbi:2-isopropylmalate synthase [Chitinimonas sp. BJB300]|uniref:2-isopropylmalate synthase n=1 Tax=Chitinimonas sp. BJB300 TaxID=1559339 RepID=UPI000C0D6357|nr:2-isopropylmalate synthase [Chitinimonas sp. BJB300]PHV09833.1 2-isopropylmalate synthase [Chitinimonas sp. BJB300]TSJ87492.1 2-isopropylmalate synthase [Chitinimonas sp. BJB300]
MLKNANSKYRPFPTLALPNRIWPTQVIERAPIWMSTDLRDGNQALFEPMNAERKLRMFETLVAIGIKEIEVAFPSASKTDFDFVRKLIEEDRIPPDVTIEVLTQAREHLIRRTIESLIGARRAIVHVYNATARSWREQVFSMECDEVRDLAVEAVSLIKNLTAQHPETEWVLQYSPETFSQTEPDFALSVCNAVIDAWGPTPTNKLIINLPATVEAATPNVYADQVEFMHRHLAQRDSVVLSVHPHNDRGTAVAAAELAMMAGADRVEGCLFGNGERTGNVDLVTLALNLYTQGVDPGLNFADINHVARTVEDCTQLPIHPRHPYVGDLVFTAFSGSHQDAIKKGLAYRKDGDIWDVPYLPIDPADLGRSYESVIRVNSQSGKGGIAYLLESQYGLVMPRRLQVEFSGVVQKHTDTTGAEVNADELWRMFGLEYLEAHTPMRLHGHHLLEDGNAQGIELIVEINGQSQKMCGSGNGPIAAAVAALGTPVKVMSYEERSLGHGADARAVAFVEVAMDGVDGSVFGVGLHSNIITASILALISAINRATARTQAGVAQQAA